MQRIIVHGPQPHHVHVREPTRDPIHQNTASATEVILHSIAGSDGVVLGEFGQLVLATDVLRGGLLDDEVGAEGGGGDLAAIRAVADEGLDKAVAFRGLKRMLSRFSVVEFGDTYEFQLDRTTIACCSCRLSSTAS